MENAKVAHQTKVVKVPAHRPAARLGVHAHVISRAWGQGVVAFVQHGAGFDIRKPHQTLDIRTPQNFGRQQGADPGFNNLQPAAVKAMAE